MLLGAHVSVSGGVENAPQRAEILGCTAMQIFTRNQRQWESKPLLPEHIDRFMANLAVTSVRSVIAHNSYLINLGTSDPAVREKSLNAFLDEIQRAEKLRIPCLVFHPGSHLGIGEEKGLALIADHVNELLEKTAHFGIKLLLETTAGQGTGLGHTFAQLQSILSRVRTADRLGVCVDTCHVFAAGYDLRTREAYTATMSQFDGEIGLDRIQAIHLNDSKKPLGSRVDRHENIGQGFIGPEAFRFIMNDARLLHVPKILETPGGDAYFLKNLNLLRSLVEK
ncbi:MAG: deoxyribonuclease IV [Candidatus Zhuqueibacterota bacterium]